MRFGCSTMFLREQQVAAALDVIADAGFTSAEVWIEHIWASGEAPEKIRQHADAVGIDLTVHAATYDVNICSSNPGIRRESMRQIEESLDIAARLRAQVITVHPGRFSSSRDSADLFWDYLIQAVSQIDDLAASYGLRLGMEGMEKRRREFFVYPDDLARLFNRAWKKVGLTIDLAHAQTIMNPLDYLAQIPAERIVHVHCSDNSRDHTHLPLGQGDLGLPVLLAALRQKYDGLVSLEGYVPGQGEKIVCDNARYLQSLGVM